MCGAGEGAQPQWTLKAPDAVLHDKKGTAIGHHFDGPTWKHIDGSEVLGKAVARADSPDKSSIPWLLVSVTRHEGKGILAGVTSIQRLHTRGGQTPPGESCTAARQGAEARVRYSADYYFYAPSKH